MKYVFMLLFLLSAQAFGSEFQFSYKNSTHIRDVGNFVSKVTGNILIMDRNTRGEFQLIKDKPLTSEEVWETYKSILSDMGLRAFNYKDNIYLIVPERRAKKANFNITANGWEAKAPNSQIGFSYEDLVSIRKIITDLHQVAGIDFVFDRNLNGKVQITGAQTISQKKMVDVSYAALQLLGLDSISNGSANYILTKRYKKKVSDIDFVSHDNIPKSGKTIRLNFSPFFDVSDVAKYMAKELKVDFMMDEEVRGKVQILSDEDYSPAKGYNLLYGTLKMLGLTTIQSKSYIRIVPIRVAKKIGRNPGK